MVKCQISNWKGVYLGVTTCLMFFNPLSLNNEIFPYWLLLPSLLFKNVFAFIFCSTTLSIGLVNYFVYPESRAIIDSLSLICLFLGLNIYSSLNNEGRRSLCNVFIIFIILTSIVMLIQKFSPQFHNFILGLFSSRENLASFYIERNGAVTGFSPEPAYGSAMIVSLMLILHLNHKLNRFIYALILLELYLFRSITGIVYFIYISLIILLADYKKFIEYKYILLIFTVVFAVLFSNDFLIFIYRPVLFFKEFFSSGNLIDAESIFGSHRIVSVFYSIKLYIQGYTTGFSPIAVFSNLCHTILIPIIILLIYASPNVSKNFFLCLPFLFFGGPTLMWPMQVLVLKNKK
jgi:hypothetical protein